MTLVEEFEAAQVRIKQLQAAPNPTTLLSLYALYKQGTTGDVQGSRPGMLDIRGRAKFDAWAGKKGTTKDAAMQAYVKLVDSLVRG